MDMHTDLIAVPHAGLGFHFLRVRVRTTEPRGLQEEIGPKSQDRRRRSSRHDDVRSGLPNVATCEVLPFRRLGKWQVRLADQARYPHVLWPLRWTIAHSTWMVPLL